MTVRTMVASKSENAGREAKRRCAGEGSIHGIQPRLPTRASPICSALFRFLPSHRFDPMRPRPTRHSSSPLASFVRRASSAVLLLAAASCANPRAQAAIVQELNDAASEISAVKGDVAQLQNDVDSLRQVIAKQDTVISRLVEVTHVPR